MSGIGHNRGPSMEPGLGWRRHAWGRARAALLPPLPLEVVRLRVRRAEALGLDYRTYAGVRATTGRDLVAFLFSSNVLRLDRDGRVAADRALRLDRVAECGRIALVHAPADPSRVAAANAGLDAAHAAPWSFAPWGAIRGAVDAALGPLPRDGVLVIGAAGFERDWSLAGRLAGYLPEERFFGPG